MVIRPHDLIEVSRVEHIVIDEKDDWVAEALNVAPYVVVRRGEAGYNGQIPVGIRGKKRNQRQAAMLQIDGVKKLITPYDITANQMWKNLISERQITPIIQKMPIIDRILSGYRWGPTGSGGFEMVTGIPTLSETSDLDILIHTPEAINFTVAESLLQQLDQLSFSVDIQVDTGSGTFILREWVNQRTDSLILRTNNGLKLVKDPWENI